MPSFQSILLGTLLAAPYAATAVLSTTTIPASFTQVVRARATPTPPKCFQVKGNVQYTKGTPDEQVSNGWQVLLDDGQVICDNEGAESPLKGSKINCSGPPGFTSQTFEWSWPDVNGPLTASYCYDLNNANCASNTLTQGQGWTCTENGASFTCEGEVQVCGGAQ
ncbi:hypothetical protein BU24DRAFT_463884 [Aaosphaeria arxii CBS 175.79]|uniref:Ig-like domain-containing protein n=1 Tax=Aaosphaeria arxii CBS 175.79 TaxID=1450172 RepID=A0A6A5XPJ6_9PLEO|nr:uncharacterized protein BU24DRAFT_463884 [Aaosphaeria arxii CBS 175.79]KAF2015168.1 hypothetical protein BU24DRAFT_463884 [Aaosphaeria arxii CBS 175.79]